MRIARILEAVVVVVAWPLTATAGEPKLSVDTLVERHKAALGTASDPAAGPRVLEGACRFEIRRGGAARLDGQTRFSSEARRLRLDFKFDHSAYGGESFSSDGEAIDVGFFQPLKRSPLGGFLNTHDALLKEGLLGGTLSRAWPLLDLDARKPKLRYDGIKKLGKRPVHQLRYEMARGQGELAITLYFEADTFLHVGSVFSLRLRPGLGQGIEASASQVDVIQRLEESFDDFVSVEGLVLPRRWTLEFETGGGAPDSFWIWETQLARAVP